MKRSDILAFAGVPAKQFESWLFRNLLPFDCRSTADRGGLRADYSNTDADALRNMVLLRNAGLTVEKARQISMNRSGLVGPILHLLEAEK